MTSIYTDTESQNSSPAADHGFAPWDVESPPVQAGEAPDRTEGQSVVGEKTEGADRSGAPESYDSFALPEGFDVDEGVLAEFGELARSLNLSQDAAQGLVTFHSDQIKTATDRIARLQRDAFFNQLESWREQTRQMVGDAKMDETLTIAKEAVRRFGGEEISELLIQTGLGNHPAMVRMFAAIGQSIGEDQTVLPLSAQGAARPSAANILFKNQK